jgi:hypothetical protein
LHQSEFDFNPESTFEIQVLQEKRRVIFLCVASLLRPS